jgi:hypothetical protein
MQHLLQKTLPFSLERGTYVQALAGSGVYFVAGPDDRFNFHTPRCPKPLVVTKA